jgi:hypothetical protein
MIHSDNEDTVSASPLTQVSAVFLLLCLLAITAHFSTSQSTLAVAEPRSGNTLSDWHNDLSLAQPGIAWRFSAVEQERSEPPKITGVDHLASFPDPVFASTRQPHWLYPVITPAFLAATFYPSQAPPVSAAI